MINVINRLKRGIKKEIKNQNYENALHLISILANILYETNQYYVDEELESDLSIISKKLKPLLDSKSNSEVILFYDGFGLNSRGLAQIYLKALTKIKHVVYVTDINAKERIPDILSILNKHDVIFLKEKSFTKRIHELSSVITSFSVSSFFFYSVPNDVVGTVVLNAYKGKRYQINLTDHAFWLGARCIDTCIEFRDYGASVSNHYRKINKIVKIPFYPIIDYNKEFEGYPFNSENKKIVFSGGALYKTFGGGNYYYKIVDYILGHHRDVVFWYAGNGDRRKMDRIIAKYPQRVFVTGERNDLFQVLCHCYFYLSTYPICGGLMFQYAAAAGKVPVTLKFDSISDGFLINQERLGIEYCSFKEVIKEIDRLIENEEYALHRGNAVRNSLICEEDFNSEISKLFSDSSFSYDINYSRIDTSSFRKTYKDRNNARVINELLVKKDGFVVFKYCPIRYFCGCISKMLKRIIRKIKR